MIAMATLRRMRMQVVSLFLATRLADTFSRFSQPLPQIPSQGENVGMLSHGDFGESLPSLREINPIIYLHIPESGAGFATTIAHHACGTDIPDDVSVDEPAEFTAKWAGVCSSARFGRFQSGRDPLPLLSDVDKSHVVVMIRDPIERIISGYYNEFYDCDDLRTKYNCGLDQTVGNFRCDGDITDLDGRYVRNPAVAPPLEYGRCVENCAANMLTGRRCDDSGSVDASRAVELIDEVGFVGLSDEWALSVCLWHRKFGGRTLPVELATGRPGVAALTSRVASRYNARSLLGEWRPEADTQVFIAAFRRFWREIHQFGIVETACEREAAMLVEGTQSNFDSSPHASIVSKGPSAAVASPDYINTAYHQTADVQQSSYRDVNPSYSTQGNYLLNPWENVSADTASAKPAMTIVDRPSSPYDSNLTLNVEQTSFGLSQATYVDPMYTQNSQSRRDDGTQSNFPLSSDINSQRPVPALPGFSDEVNPTSSGYKEKPTVEIYPNYFPSAQKPSLAVPTSPVDINPVQPEDARRLSFGIDPIHYLHLPQTGSGFATVVAHHVCGPVLSEEETVEEPSEFLEKWGRACDPSRFGHFASGHDPLSVTEAEVQRVVMMVRDPAQRTISGYHHALSDCDAITRKYNCKAVFGQTKCDGDIETDDGHYKRDPNSISPIEYAKCVENCTANMLTGRSCDYSGSVDIDRAVRVVDEAGFVGLTGEWALSTCLWHRRFGGRMLPSELKRMRSSFEGSTEDGIAKFNERTLLGHWYSEAEYAVFGAAERRFWREIEQFGVDPDSCEQEATALVHKTPANSISMLPDASGFDAPSRNIER
eukprot:TRINITY_DN8446_c1_g1_i1.p1 TRINITY_DN8446_c1_g1~~TRINITY_DN8446_c1_g1_i1.p1  ORF type:complete len:824 (+),score=83.49 TRINITY_DN8446_c1_g1_i1:47-2518(+)